MIGLHFHGPAPGLLLRLADRIGEAMYAIGAQHRGYGQGQRAENDECPVDQRHRYKSAALRRARGKFSGQVQGIIGDGVDASRRRGWAKGAGVLHEMLK